MGSRVEKKRIAYWDMAKGFTMLLVIVAHIPQVPVAIRGLIFSFHMPLFFVANGFFVKDYDILKTLKKSVKSLLLPYAITGVISAFLYVLNNLGTGYSAGQLAIHYLISVVVGMSGSSTIFQSMESVGPIWFLTALFLCRNIYVIIMHFVDKWNVILQGLLMAAISAAGCIIGVKIAWLPWSADLALAALIFMWMGNMLAKYPAWDRRFWPVMGIGGVIWLVPVVLRIKIELALRLYPYGPVPFIEAAAGTFVVVGLFYFLEKKNINIKALTWIGRNSIVLLCVHALEQMHVKWDERIWPLFPFNVPWPLMIVIRIALVLGISIVFVKLKNLIKSSAGITKVK